MSLLFLEFSELRRLTFYNFVVVCPLQLVLAVRCIAVFHLSLQLQEQDQVNDISDCEYSWANVAIIIIILCVYSKTSYRFHWCVWHVWLHLHTNGFRVHLCCCAEFTDWQSWQLRWRMCLPLQHVKFHLQNWTLGIESAVCLSITKFVNSHGEYSQIKQVCSLDVMSC